MKITTPIVALGTIRNGAPTVKNKPWFLSQFQNIDDCNIRWIVEKEKKSRSRGLENFLWGVVYPLASQSIGYRPDELHEVFCSKFLKTTKKWRGSDVETITSSSRLNKDEYSEFYERIIQELAELNIIVPDPDKYYKEREEFGDKAVQDYIHKV